ncbi:MAG: N-formylglutamate amidohydrolase [Proteobacteria bacterium]|nr:N-formylglutamate amidohydrolase [Pseudomonadota bacterium]
MITPQLAPAFEILPGPADAGLLLVCDHAENTIPPDLDQLGLSEAELSRHIAYDIGAKALTHALSGMLNAPAVLSRFSRLVIDPNRGEDDPTLVMRLADGAMVPGNARTGLADVEARLERFYRPYDSAIRTTLEAMEATGIMPVMLCVHSFTPQMKGRARPWHATLIWDHDPRFSRPFLAALEAEAGLIIGENEPYQGGLIGDTVDRHALPRGLAHTLLEVRQDLIGTPQGVAAWAARLARLLRPLLADPTLHRREYHGTLRENALARRSRALKD